MLISAIHLLAQETVPCKRDFVIKTNVTPSTCMANGVVEVSLEGDLSELELELTEYSIRPIEGTEGTSLQFSRNNTLRSIAAGIYVVSVRTFCIGQTTIGVVTESANVVVGGNYKPLMAEFDLIRMRKSYADCATGLIAFNVKSGTGYGDLSFFISKAPTGVPIGEVTPTKGSTISGYVQYVLPDLYPSGDYQIDVYDSCSKATMIFNLGETSVLPTPSSSGSAFYPTGTSCNEVNWRPSSPSNNETDHYYKHYLAGLYEIALLPKDQIPVESDWVVWGSSSSFNVTLPDSYKNYFSAGSLVVHIRLKACNQINKTISTRLNTPYLSGTSSVSRYCDYYTRGIRSWNDYDSFWCYPITVKIIDTDTKEILFSETHTTAAARDLLAGYQYTYGKSYTIELTDASDHKYPISNGITNFTPSVSLSTSSSGYKCTTFTGSVLVTSSYYCYPIDVKVYKENDAGDFDLFDEFSLTSSSKAIEYPYGKYRVDATYEYVVPSTGEKCKSSVPTTVLSARPTSITLSTSVSASASYEKENYAYLQVRGNTSTFPAGTRFTVTDAPDGYQHKGRTFTISSSTSSFYIGNSNTSSSSSPIYMPIGNYTVTVEDDCGTSVASNPTWFEAGYDAKDVKYLLEEAGCDGARIKLNTQEGGYAKYNGIASGSYTNFRIISGPSGGYETTLKSYSQDLKIVADGEYVIGTVVNSSSSYANYYIRRDTIYYQKSKPILNPSVTSSYVCTDPEALYGYMIFTGQGGKSPYRYELLDENENATGLTATGAEGEKVVFNYGLAGETYIVRITDDCGNSTTQQMTLADLKTQSIVYSIPPDANYCTGSELKLNCVTLGQTQYLWEKKVSEGVYEFISNEQNPRIFPLTKAHSGTYRVTVTPEYCGEAITGEVTIKVYPSLEAGAVSSNQDICVSTRGATMSCVLSGGKGAYSYQWQNSIDQTTWTDVAQGTTSTYAPLHKSSGTYYYRLVVTDDCDVVTSDTITVNVKPCYIMVNPNISTKVDR